MSKPAAQASLSWRFVLIGLLAAAGAAGIGWGVGKYRSGPRLPHLIETDFVASRQQGQRIYTLYCASCHGPEGRGDGPAAAGLQPPPIDFSSPARKQPSLDSLHQVIREGVRGTAMPAFGAVLSAADLGAVTEYVVEFARRSPSELRSLLQSAGFSDLHGIAPPPLQVVDAQGTRRQWSDLRGKVVLLHFWSKGCLPCLQEMPLLQEVEQAYSSRLIVLHVCTDEPDPAAAQATLEQYAPGAKSYVEPTGVGLVRFDVTVLPTVWLLDSRGNAQGRALGSLNWRSAQVRNLLVAYLPKMEP